MIPRSGPPSKPGSSDPSRLRCRVPKRHKGLRSKIRDLYPTFGPTAKDLRRRQPQDHGFLPQTARPWGIRCPVTQAPTHPGLVTHKPPVLRYSSYEDLSLSSGFGNIATDSRPSFGRCRRGSASVAKISANQAARAGVASGIGTRVAFALLFKLFAGSLPTPRSSGWSTCSYPRQVGCPPPCCARGIGAWGFPA